MSPLEPALRRIEVAPTGPRVGAFFDFDGTLIDGYSAAAYFKDRLRRRDMGARELIDTIKLTRRKHLDEAGFAEVIGKGVMDWAGMHEDEMYALWQRLWISDIASTIFPEAWRLVQAHKRKGHTVVIASSATPYQIAPLAQEFEIEHVLATQPMIRRQCLTGGIDGAPLWGQGKADAVRGFCRERRIALKRSFGYANGDEDIAFLSALGYPTAVQPKEMLETLASEKDWPVLRFAPRRRAPKSAAVRTMGAYAAMAGSFVAGLGVERLTGDTRRAADFITCTASDAAMRVLGITVQVVQGAEHLVEHRPCVFIINHQSKLDMFLMMNLIRDGFSGVAKKEAASVPGFGRYMRMTDMAFLDRSHTGRSIDALKPAVRILQQGLSIAIAPEGTRSYTPRVGRFKKGAFHLARQAGVPIVPVVIRNAGEVMGRNDQVMRGGTVEIVVLPAIHVSQWQPEAMDEQVEAVRQQFVDTLQNWPSAAAP